MGLSITVLGCDGTYAGPGGACTGYLVRSDRTTVWLDTGPGTLANLQQHAELADVDAVVVTHEHPDHCLDLPVARSAARHVLGVEAIPLYTTGGTLDVLQTVVGELEPTFLPTVVDATTELEIGDQQWRFSRTDHPVETLACRVDSGGGALVSSSDTGSGWSAGTLGGGVDLALVEATLPAEERGSAQHLTGEEAGLLAARAGVARLVLTHLLPGADPDERVAGARRHFDGPVEVATIHERYQP